MAETVLELVNNWDDKFQSIKEIRIKKKICGWCNKRELKYSYKKYLINGNICPPCISKMRKKVELKREANHLKFQERKLKNNGKILHNQQKDV